MINFAIIIEDAIWGTENMLRPLTERAIMASCQYLQQLDQTSELSLVFTNDSRIQALNRDWRNKDYPTNVLSFPIQNPIIGAPFPALLGDIVLAYQTIDREAQNDKKNFDDHLTHLIIHGFLHLLGYDHENEQDAEIMEMTEINILKLLDISNPYTIF